MKPAKRSLISIMSESYSVYFEFFGIILAWMLVEYLITKNVSYISIVGGVIHASFKAYQAVMKKY
tara:strand:+ start:42 stop:236 length:195 start_codon:yes stop_codon:yes gene_type:complete